MASSKEFVEYVVSQLAGAGTITCKRMFGEYGLYCGGLFFGVICDDQLFVKPTKAGKEFPISQSEAPPYEGAKPYILVEDIDNPELLAELVQVTCQALPAPKPKKPKAVRDKKGAKPGESDAPVSADKQKPGKLDYKKAYKDLYQPKASPSVIDVPEMRFIMVDGKGNPNTSPVYQAAVGLLYGLSMTIKMSPRNNAAPDGYFDYVVPPLEGFWWASGDLSDVDFSRINKEEFCWTIMIRQPEFVTEEVFEAARQALGKKRPDTDTSKARFEIYREGLCCQAMHTGSYDTEPATLELIHRFMEENGYESDFSDTRRHHEIYLGDPRKTAPERLKTVLRLPVRQKGQK